LPEPSEGQRGVSAGEIGRAASARPYPRARTGGRSADSLPTTPPVGPRVRGALELIGLVVAPTTLLTALAYYFGWTLTNARALYFGIDPSALGFSTQDYILRSTDALFVPLAVLVLAALAAVAIHSLVRTALWHRRFRNAILQASWVCGAIGSVLLTLGVVAMFRPLPLLTYYLFAPVSPGLGALLVAYAAYLRWGWLPPVAVGLLVSLVVLSGFWAVSKYADALGRGRAKQLARSLSTRPSVVVYSKHRLQLPVPEKRLNRRDSAYAFRYAGLRLLVRSGGKYFLVPEGWSKQDGVAIALADTNELRVEFSPCRAPQKDHPCPPDWMSDRESK
jgi:hypothetical protein